MPGVGLTFQRPPKKSKSIPRAYSATALPSLSKKVDGELSVLSERSDNLSTRSEPCPRSKQQELSVRHQMSRSLSSLSMRPNRDEGSGKSRPAPLPRPYARLPRGARPRPCGVTPRAPPLPRTPLPRLRRALAATPPARCRRGTRAAA